MSKTHLSHLLTALFVALFFINGCADHNETLEVTPAAAPEISTAYLLEHRIISYDPKYREKVIHTLPYEIKKFDESYIIYLVARLPDSNSTTVWKAKEPHYYLWLERSSDNWRDFTTVKATALGELKIDSNYSSIREGRFYKEYTIDFTLEQLYTIKGPGLELVLKNQQGVESTVSIPSLYIEAYLQMLPRPSQ